MTQKNVCEELIEEHHLIDAQLTDLINGTCCLAGEDQATARKIFREASDTLIEHIRFEEEWLFTLLEERMGFSSEQGPTAVMRHEHSEFRAYLDEGGRKLEAGHGERFRSTLKLLANGLAQHNTKEEQVLYPMALQHMQPDEMFCKETIGKRTGNKSMTVDVRAVEPKHRHPMIFNKLNSLRPSEAMVLVNDHDPVPLYYQLQATHPGEFDWIPMEQGPEIWKIKIHRK